MANIENEDIENALREIERILRSNNHYAVLDVPFEADHLTVKNCYRELARIVHPDKNRNYLEENPNRESDFKEAFQKIEEAYRVLTQSEDNDANDGFDDDDDDVIEVKEESDLNDKNDSETPEKQEPKDAPTGRNLFIYHPVILLVLIPAIAYFVGPLLLSSPIFRLERNSDFSIKRQTEYGKIRYFVSKDFDTEFKNQYDTLDELEMDVIDAYGRRLRIKCNRENRKDELLQEALITGNENTYREATAAGTPSCDKLIKITIWQQSKPKYRKFFKFIEKIWKKLRSWY